MIETIYDSIDDTLKVHFTQQSDDQYIKPCIAYFFQKIT